MKIDEKQCALTLMTYEKYVFGINDENPNCNLYLQFGFEPSSDPKYKQADEVH